MVTFGNGSKVGGLHQATMFPTEPRPGVPVPSEFQLDTWSYRRTTSSQDCVDAAAWGADEQLRLCVEHLRANGWIQVATALQTAMRPKPPSLKQQALEDLESMPVEPCIIRTNVDEYKDLNEELHAKYLRIRRAIESIPGD